MKRVLVGLMVLGLTVGSQATTYVTWGEDGFASAYLNYGGGPYPANALAAGSIVQLIYSANSTIGAIDNVNPFAPTGGDQLMVSSTVGAGGIFSYVDPITTTSQYNFPDDTYFGGYAYMRVFQTDSTTVTDGQVLRYAQGPSSGLNITFQPNQSPAPATSINLSGALGPFFALDQSVTIVGVPEPMTIGLFGLGLLTVALRRKISKTR